MPNKLIITSYSVCTVSPVLTLALAEVLQLFLCFPFNCSPGVFFLTFMPSTPRTEDGRTTYKMLWNLSTCRLLFRSQNHTAAILFLASMAGWCQPHSLLSICVCTARLMAHAGAGWCAGENTNIDILDNTVLVQHNHRDTTRLFSPDARS